MVKGSPFKVIISLRKSLLQKHPEQFSILGRRSALGKQTVETSGKGDKDGFIQLKKQEDGDAPIIKRHFRRKALRNRDRHV